jgi:hypothetical protein
MMTWLCFVSGPALICIQIYLLNLGGKGFARFFFVQVQANLFNLGIIPVMVKGIKDTAL